jgi:hypothetical protein
MPRTKSKADEIDDIVDDLDDLEEEDEEEEEEDEEEAEDEEDEDEEEDDPDEAPKAKKSRKSRTKKAAKPKPEKTGIGTKEVADAAGIESRQLRAFLRSAGYQGKDEREGRYWWKSLNDPEVKEILKKVKGGAVDKMNKEKLADLKSRKSTKKTTAKKTTAKKRRTKE